MKKQILNLGKALSKAEQKQVNGGFVPVIDNGEGGCRQIGESCVGGNTGSENWCCNDAWCTTSDTGGVGVCQAI